MSVLIKGMTMPKDKFVAVVIHPDGTAYTTEMTAGVCTKYLADCTAVLVPPHGILIDADAMIDHLEFNIKHCTINGHTAQRYREMIVELCTAPIVIEAEEGEEEK